MGYRGEPPVGAARADGSVRPRPATLRSLTQCNLPDLTECGLLHSDPDEVFGAVPTSADLGEIFKSTNPRLLKRTSSSSGNWAPPPEPDHATEEDSFKDF